MYTFKNHLLTEAQAEEAMPAEDMTGRVKQMMRVLATLSGEEKFEQRLSDVGGYSELDLIEALNLINKVSKERLEQENVEGYEESKDDKKKGFDSLKTSISAQIKETMNSYFQIPADTPGGKSKLPRFVNAFNNHIVDPIIDAAFANGPENALPVIEQLTSKAKSAVENMTITVTAEDTKAARSILNNYSRMRAQTIGKKPASQMTKQDRLRLIRRMAMKVQASA